ncbi:hypothetical protein P4361_01665 [Fictibacillus sp. B-59209]|uniref:hypothetical protein n=1 Tax=Fictibacillus sp. B-59209 TaxID=3024873 RepID=UPI002E1E1FED|nr:hypothetical protein [Fictibacillus sp. B-59209]
MSDCYRIKISDSEETQSQSDLSFLGGKPRVPKSIDIPKCELCGEEQSFFFQIAFPENHKWNEFSMAVFACTSCAHEGYFIPEMLEDELSGINIPSDFLREYQKNFRIEVFKTTDGAIQTNYKEKVKFKRITLIEEIDKEIFNNKIGGSPNWVADDETPGSYNKTEPMVFLMQLLEDFKFEKLPDAPSQVKLSFTKKQEPSNRDYYELFLGNNIYFFGTASLENPLVYVLTQI